MGWHRSSLIQTKQPFGNEKINIWGAGIHENFFGNFCNADFNGAMAFFSILVWFGFGGHWFLMWTEWMSCGFADEHSKLMSAHCIKTRTESFTAHFSFGLHSYFYIPVSDQASETKRCDRINWLRGFGMVWFEWMDWGCTSFKVNICCCSSLATWRVVFEWESRSTTKWKSAWAEWMDAWIQELCAWNKKNHK